MFEAIARLVDASLSRSAVRTARPATSSSGRSGPHPRDCRSTSFVELPRGATRGDARPGRLPRRATGLRPNGPSPCRCLDREMPHLRAVLAPARGRRDSVGASRRRPRAGRRPDRLLARAPSGRGPGLARPAASRRPVRPRPCAPRPPSAARTSPTGSPTSRRVGDGRRGPSARFAALRRPARRRPGPAAPRGDRRGDRRRAAGPAGSSRPRWSASTRPTSSARSARPCSTWARSWPTRGCLDDAARLLAASLTIAVASGDPLARGHALAALNLADWKGGDLGAAMRRRGGPGDLPRARPPADRGDGHLPPGRGRPRARPARVPLDATPARRSRPASWRAPARRLPSVTSTWPASTLTTGETASAAAHLVEALDATRSGGRPLGPRRCPGGRRPAGRRDRRPTGPRDLLGAAAAAIRLAIHQPVAPTELADVEATRRQAAIRPTSSISTPVGVAAVLAEALAVARGRPGRGQRRRPCVERGPERPTRAGHHPAAACDRSAIRPAKTPGRGRPGCLCGGDWK